MRTIVIAALVAAAGLMPSASAAPEPEVPESCSVGTSGASSCEFACFADGEIGASLDVTRGSLGISGSCGGGSVGCETTSKCSATNTSKTVGTGTCQLSRSAGGSGTGSCYGKPPGPQDPPPEKCIDLVILCVIPPGGSRIEPPETQYIVVPCAGGAPDPKEFETKTNFGPRRYLEFQGGC